MSIFPFINPEAVKSELPRDELPMFREYAYDFKNNKLLLKNGNTYLVEGNEALRIWIYNALTTTRYKYVAFTSDFGNEIDSLIGYVIDPDILSSEIRRFIIEALMVNPYIRELSNFNFDKIPNGMKVEFDCTTIYGIERTNHQIKGVSI